jgi:hypothetical protein
LILVAITTGDNAIKERLSMGLLSLIAARAGCEVIAPHTDYMSIDAIIRPVQGRNMPIDVQLKASNSLEFTDNAVKFRLTLKNYEDLRSTTAAVPQLLVVVDLHGDANRWVNQDSDLLRFERSAYWLSLYGLPPTDNTTSIGVQIPRTQVFTPNALADIYDRYEQRLAAGLGGL